MKKLDTVKTEMAFVNLSYFTESSRKTSKTQALLLLEFWVIKLLKWDISYVGLVLEMLTYCPSVLHQSRFYARM